MGDEMNKPYRRIENVDVPEYELCVGPDGFECSLTEPEDRTFYRDASVLLDEMNRLHAEIERLRARNEALEQVAKAAGEDHRYHTRPESDECAVCASLTALSAINHPTTLDGSGGGT